MKRLFLIIVIMIVKIYCDFLCFENIFIGHFFIDTILKVFPSLKNRKTLVFIYKKISTMNSPMILGLGSVL